MHVATNIVIQNLPVMVQPRRPSRLVVENCSMKNEENLVTWGGKLAGDVAVPPLWSSEYHDNVTVTGKRPHEGDIRLAFYFTQPKSIALKKKTNLVQHCGGVL